MLRFERDQPTSIARLGKIALIGVFAAVVIVGFVAPWIVRYQYATLSAGDPVMIPEQPGVGGTWTVIEVKGDTVILESDDGKKRSFPTKAVREL